MVGCADLSKKVSMHPVVTAHGDIFRVVLVFEYNTWHLSQEPETRTRWSQLMVTFM